MATNIHVLTRILHKNTSKFVTVRPPVGLNSTRQQLRQYGYVHVPKKTVPHLLGHGNLWRKCRVVHPCTQEINCLEKYQWLTKTRVVNNLPLVFNKIKAPDETIFNDFEERLYDYITQMVNDKLKWRPFSDVRYGILQAVMPSLWQLGAHYGHIKHSYWAIDPHIECFWKHSGINYITFGNPLAALYTPSALQFFLFPDQEPLGDLPPNDLIPSHIGLFEHSFDKINVSGGNKRLSVYPFAHTLIINNKTSATPQQTTAHALMQLFAQSTAQTVLNGYPLNSVLEFPLSTQAVLTDGQNFTFACYQLNTLNFDDDDSSSSSSNILWIAPTLQLYDDYKNITSFNRECLGLLFKFLLNRTLRKAPLKYKL